MPIELPDEDNGGLTSVTLRIPNSVMKLIDEKRVGRRSGEDWSRYRYMVAAIKYMAENEVKS